MRGFQNEDKENRWAERLKTYLGETYGSEIANREFNWDQAFEQRHIPIVSKNVVLDKGRLSIKFDDRKQAKSFEGIGFIG